MIVVDNCIISSLSKIKCLELLKYYNDIRTSDGVVQEAFKSEIDIIIKPLSEALTKWIKVVHLDLPQEIPLIQEKHPYLSFVDCELILLCKENDAVLFSDDSHLMEVAESEFGIETYDLCDIILSLKNGGKLNQEQIDRMIVDLRKKDHYKFSNDDLSLLNAQIS